MTLNPYTVTCWSTRPIPDHFSSALLHDRYSCRKPDWCWPLMPSEPDQFPITWLGLIELIWSAATLNRTLARLYYAYNCRSSSSSSARLPSPRPIKSYRRPSLSSHSGSDDDDDDDDQSIARSSSAAATNVFSRNNGDSVASNRSLTASLDIKLKLKTHF